MKNGFITGNANSILASLHKDVKQKFNLILTSPPYNVGKEYENKKSIAEYLEETDIILYRLIEALHPDGSLCWNTENYINDKEVFPLDIYFYNKFKHYGLKLRNRIIWHYGHGLHCNTRFSNRYETILWFTKSDNYTFNLDNVRVPSKYPGKKHFKGPKKGQLSGNPLGKNPSDVWEVLLNDWEKEIWNIPNVKHNHPEKTLHPCQFPVELAERCILALTNEKDWILDPFGGVGTTLIASLKNNRNAVCIEKEAKYVREGEKRIKMLKAGKLKFRSMTKPLHNPTKSNNNPC